MKRRQKEKIADEIFEAIYEIISRYADLQDEIIEWKANIKIDDEDFYDSDG